MEDKEPIEENESAEGYYEAFVEQKESQTPKIEAERSQIKDTMAKKLTEIGFTKLEIAEVLDVITLGESNIQILKDSLIGTNINTYDPTPVMKKVMDEIRELNIQMGEDIKAKIKEIQIRKETKKALDNYQFGRE